MEVVGLLLVVAVSPILGRNILMSVDGKYDAINRPENYESHLRPIRQTSSTCTGGYEEISDSTMCLTDSPNYVAGTATMSEANKTIILQEHNEYRSNVDPKAKNMPKLYWSDELASLAQKWAKQCLFGHEENFGKSRVIPGWGGKPGQNGAFGAATWSSHIQGWHAEVANFSYGTGSTNGGKIGHYTQVVSDKAFLVGCGYAKCTNGWKHYFFCNYWRGQLTDDKPKPYEKSSSSCSGCPNSCEDKLCDCEGSACRNEGTMNRDTCECSCTLPWTGDECMEKNCNGITEPSYCGTPSFPKSYCEQYSNVPTLCPLTCEVCP